LNFSYQRAVVTSSVVKRKHKILAASCNVYYKFLAKERKVFMRVISIYLFPNMKFLAFLGKLVVSLGLKLEREKVQKGEIDK
jgi:hypothetical protein